jgi:hypothetical protein
MGANVRTPALFTSTSSFPKVSTVSATVAAQPSSLVTSWRVYRQAPGVLLEPVVERHVGSP